MPTMQELAGQYKKQSSPDMATLAAQYKSDWNTAGGDVAQKDPESFTDTVWNRFGANVQAGYTGVLELGSSMAKLADKIGLAPAGTAQKAQSAFEEAEKIYQQGTFPETAVTRFAGSMLPAAPLSAPVGLLAKWGAIKAAPTLGKYIGASAGGALSGAATGGLMNTVGQSPEDVFNEKGAQTGTALGAALGPAGHFLSKYGENTAAYQTGKETLKAAGYTGPILARDFGDEAIAGIKSKWMDNIIDTGVRNEQLAAITPAIKNVLGSIINRTEQQGAHRVGQIVRGVNNRLEAESASKWDDLFMSAKEQGISKIDTTATKQSTSQFLTDYSQFLSKKDKSILSTLSQAKQVDFKTLNKVKGSDIWKMSEKFGKAGGSVNDDIADGLKNIYWNITDDIGNTLKSNPALSQSWEQARSFTQGVKEIFNVRNNRQLVNAIDDINENTGQLKTFINAITKPVSGKSADYYNAALGEPYKNAVNDLTFNKIFTDSFSSNARGLNLNQFFRGVKEANASHLLEPQMVKALGGLEKYFDKIQTAQIAARQATAAKQLKNASPYLKSAAVGSGYIAGGLPGAAVVTAIVFAGPALLSKISKSSWAKNILIGISNVYGKNAKTTEYLMDLVGKKMSQAGVIMKENPEGVTADIKRTQE